MREAWVDKALDRSLTHIKQRSGKLDLDAPEAELELLSVEEDDLGVTTVLLEQVYKGVPVFGGQLVVHLNAAGELLADPAHDADRIGISGGVVKAQKRERINGRIYKSARRVDTVPSINPSQAVEAAVAALGQSQNFAKRPEAELLILPHVLKNTGPEDAGRVSLVYRVELLVEDGVNVPSRHWYFVDAHDGSIVWHYDAMNSGAGQSWYSGYVTIPTGWWNNNTTSIRCGVWAWDNGPWIWDGSGNYGHMESIDLKNTTPANTWLWWSFLRLDTFDDRFGMPSPRPDQWPAPDCEWERQKAGVDTQFAMSYAWNYFLLTHGRRGVDNAGYRMFSRTHYGTNADFAQWNGSNMTFGDGASGRPWVSIDTVVHEWTHAITEKTSGLANNLEAGAANESFSDIFGAMVEFLANNPVNRPDYLQGEDYIPGGYRDLSNPPSKGHPDHYNNRWFPGYCTPNDSNGGCGVHANSGIQSKAFFLLAEGGTHPHSRVSVAGVGRDAAARVFYRALTNRLIGHPNTTLHNVRRQSVNAAFDLYGASSVIPDRASEAWRAVGVPKNIIDESWFFTRQQYSDFLGFAPDQGGWDFWANQINRNCPADDAGCIMWRRVMVSRAFWDSAGFQGRADVRGSGLVNPPGSARPYDNRQFVRWCYKIYLQREPDQGGWDFWTNSLNSHGDYNQLINAFLTSGDYYFRFAFI